MKKRGGTWVGFVAGVALVFGLLIVPWPGWNAFYSAWICRLGGAIYSSDHGRLLVRLEPATPTPDRPFNLHVVLARGASPGRDATGPAMILGLDARGIGWVPTALLLALIVATPLPWPRRLRALFIGLVVAHAYVLFAIGVSLLDSGGDPAGLAAVSLPRWLVPLVQGLDETLVTQMGPGFAAAVVLWILVTFRRDDLGRLREWVTAGSGARDPTPANERRR